MNYDHNASSSLVMNEQEQLALVSADSLAKPPIETNINEIRVYLDSFSKGNINLIDERAVLSCGLGAGRSSCNSANIMESFIIADERNNRHWIYGALITAIITILLSIGCFHWSTQSAVQNGGSLAIIMCGSFMVIIAFIALLTACIRCSASTSTRNSNDCMTSDYSCFWVSSYTGSYTQMIDNILITIHLEGDIWQNQIQSIQDNISTRITGCLTRKNCKGLKRRSYGHILIAAQGVIIDELIVIAYARNILLELELINNSVQTGFILRLNFITRYYFKGAFCMDKPRTFQIDLFLPPYLQPQDIINIGQAIQFYSRIRE